MEEQEQQRMEEEKEEEKEENSHLGRTSEERLLDIDPWLRGTTSLDRLGDSQRALRGLDWAESVKEKRIIPPNSPFSLPTHPLAYACIFFTTPRAW